MSCGDLFAFEARVNLPTLCSMVPLMSFRFGLHLPLTWVVQCMSPTVSRKSPPPQFQLLSLARADAPRRPQRPPASKHNINSPRVALVRPLVSIPLSSPRPCKRADYSTWASMSQQPAASSHHGAGCPGVRRDSCRCSINHRNGTALDGRSQCRACPDTSPSLR